MNGRTWIRCAVAYRYWRRLVPWFVLRWLNDHRADVCWANVVMWRLGYDYTIRDWFRIQCKYGDGPLMADGKRYPVERGWCGKHCFISDGGIYCYCSRPVRGAGKRGRA